MFNCSIQECTHTKLCYVNIVNIICAFNLYRLGLLKEQKLASNKVSRKDLRMVSQLGCKVQYTGLFCEEK